MTPAKLTSFFNRPQLLMVVVLLLQFALALSSVTYNTPTMDEQGFLVRGLAYLRNEQRRIRVGHPLGLNALNASLLVYDETVNLPTQDPSWQGTSFHRPGELFLREIGNDVEHVMFLARLPSVWLGLLLAAVVGRWRGVRRGSRVAPMASVPGREPGLGPGRAPRWPRPVRPAPPARPSPRPGRRSAPWSRR